MQQLVKMMRFSVVVGMAMVMAACANTSDLGQGRTGKSITVTGHSYDQVWDASLAAVQETIGDQSLEVEKRLSLTKADKKAGRIEASTGMSLLSWGEVVGVFISPVTADTYTVEVESRAKLQTTLFANNWEDELLTSIQTKLDQTK